MHHMLESLRAVLDNPTEDTLKRARAAVWESPVWFSAHVTCVDEHQTLIQAEAHIIEGHKRPMIFAYVNEEQTRGIKTDATWLHQPIRLLAMSTSHEFIDLALVDGEDIVAMSHEQLMVLRDAFTLTDPVSERCDIRDSQYVDRISSFMIKARAYCMEQPDIRSLHLAALITGGAPMQAALLLDAANTSIHQEALRVLHGHNMRPGDVLVFLDRMDLSGFSTVVDGLIQQEPIYRKQPRLSWWGRMKQRWHTPRLVIVDVELTDESTPETTVAATSAPT